MPSMVKSYTTALIHEDAVRTLPENYKLCRLKYIPQSIPISQSTVMKEVVPHLSTRPESLPALVLLNTY